MRLIYVIVALVVLLAFLEIVDKTMEGKKELEATGAFKSYVEQAVAAGRIGSDPPDPSGISLPDDYGIVISGDYVELQNSSGVVARERWR